MAMTPQQQLAAAREHATIASLNDHAFLRVTGADSTRWLNGMVTNSVTALAPGEGAYNFLLNAQGRIQADCTVYRESSPPEPASFLLATTAAQLPVVQAHLDHFIIMDDVELTPAYADETSLLVLGPEAGAKLTAVGLPAPDPLRLVHADSPDGPLLLLTPAQGADAIPRFELRAATAIIDTMHRLLLQAGASGIGPETLEYLRLIEATPLIGHDIRERDLPQETAQAHALHFNKGCYLGQEIVERIRSRGQVHRVFTPFRLTGDLPVLPAPLELNGKPVGELTSAAPRSAGRRRYSPRTRLSPPRSPAQPTDRGRAVPLFGRHSHSALHHGSSHLSDNPTIDAQRCASNLPV